MAHKDVVVVGGDIMSLQKLWRRVESGGVWPRKSTPVPARDREGKGPLCPAMQLGNTRQQGASFAWVSMGMIPSNLHPGPAAGIGVGAGPRTRVGGPGTIYLEGEVVTVLFP